MWAVVVRGGHAPTDPRLRRCRPGLLLVMAIPALRLHIGQSDFASFPDSIDAVQGVNLLDEKWPEGSTLALQVVVTQADEPATQAAIDDALSERLLAIDGLTGPTDDPAVRPMAPSRS